MLDPVMLPSSRQIVDRATIARHLLRYELFPSLFFAWALFFFIVIKPIHSIAIRYECKMSFLKRNWNKRLNNGKHHDVDNNHPFHFSNSSRWCTLFYWRKETEKISSFFLWIQFLITITVLCKYLSWKIFFADFFDWMDTAIIRDIARWTDGVLQGIGFDGVR